MRAPHVPATQHNPAVTWWDTLRRRLDQWRRTFINAGDPFTLVVAVGLLLTAAMSLYAGGWPLMLGILVPTIVIGVVVAFALSRSSYNELFALLVGAAGGLAVVLLLAAFSQSANMFAGLAAVGGRVAQWIIDAFSGGINQDELVFTLLVALLFWFLSYNAAWHLFRIDRVWRVIIPSGLILISNIIFYSGSASLDGFVLVYLFFALLLIVRSNLDAREWDWYLHGIRVPSNLRRQFLAVGAALTLAVVLAVWLVPQRDLRDRLQRFQAFLQSEPLTQLAETWNRLLAPIDAQGPATSDYFSGDSLDLSGAVRLGTDIVFWASAPPLPNGATRYYWRSRVFETYEAGRWVPEARTRIRRSDAPVALVLGDTLGEARQPISVTITFGDSPSRILYAPPQPTGFDLPTSVDMRLISDTVMNVSVVRPTRVLYAGDSYSATSAISIASADQLRATSTTYPLWVSELYLNVSGSVTQRTRDLAVQIVTDAGATTPYDRAKAIERWLRANMLYNEIIPLPPVGRDPIDWFLFDQREGYCNYYASAMILMLRSLGIPARMAAGFAQGDLDTAQNLYVVEERDAHTWVEVFFPTYGWIEFEPTGGQDALERVGDVQPRTDQPTPTPPATLTPSPTPPPTLSPTPAESPTAPSVAEVMPTSTPTPTPTPTATPVIAPTQPPPPPPPPQRGVLSVLLPALGYTLLVIALLGVIAGIGVVVWWWWEWRGMGGLSPAARAYARVQRYIALIGLRFGAQQTPDERRKSIAAELPPIEPPLSAITRMYTTERYGPNRRGRAEIADQAWAEARGTILARFVRRLLGRKE
jgi:transglutaminase-like putative cysteine protease